MSSWKCPQCGATYIDVSHQEPSVLREELKLRKVKQQLAIAVEGLERFSECEDWNDPDFYIDKKEIADLADDYLKQIKEIK